MKTVLSLIITLISFTAFAQKAPIKVSDGYKIEIKTSAVCEMCKDAIERDLTFEKGVKEVNLDVDTKVVTVIYNDKKTNAETIRERITKVGYNADDLMRDPEAYENLPFCCKDGAHDND